MKSVPSGVRLILLGLAILLMLALIGYWRGVPVFDETEQQRLERSTKKQMELRVRKEPEKP